MDSHVPNGLSKTTEKHAYFINPLISRELKELFRLTRPKIYAGTRCLDYSHSEVRECPMHKHPDVYIKVYHTFMGKCHGYREICLCLSCLISRQGKHFPY